VVGWYTGSHPDYPPSAIDFSVVTHLVGGWGAPTILENGTSYCNRSGWGNESSLASQVHKLAREAGAKLQFVGPNFLVNAIYDMELRGNFLGSIRDAMKECDYDGIEWDWEGPESPQVADMFTDFLIELKAALGPGSVVSCDSEPAFWDPPDYYPLNASKMDGSNIDFINFMTYWDGNTDGTIPYYVEAVATALRKSYPPSTINIAVPFFSHTGGSAWYDRCQSCPDLDPASNNCSGVQVVGKHDAMHVGELIKFSGIGGAFPWMLDYDASPISNATCGDNSLLKWLKKGLLGGA